MHQEKAINKPTQTIPAPNLNPPKVYSRRLLAERLNPSRYGFPPLISAVVQVLLGVDLGVRGRDGERLIALTLVGNQLYGESTGRDVAVRVCQLSEFEQGLKDLTIAARLSREENELFSALAVSTLQGSDWRS